jgi:hypothetical protein
MSTDPSVKEILSAVPRDPLKNQQGVVMEAGLIASAARDLFSGAVDSMYLRAGLVMAKHASSATFHPVAGAEALSVVAIDSILIYVGTDRISAFSVGSNVKAASPGAGIINLATEIDLGAVVTVYTTSGTFAVGASKVISALAVGDYIWGEPATDDGTGDGVAILMEDVELRDDDGNNTSKSALMLLQGHVRTSMVPNIHNRALLTLAGQGPLIPKGLVVVS